MIAIRVHRRPAPHASCTFGALAPAPRTGLKPTQVLSSLRQLPEFNRHSGKIQMPITLQSRNKEFLMIHKTNLWITERIRKKMGFHRFTYKKNATDILH